MRVAVMAVVLAAATSCGGGGGGAGTGGTVGAGGGAAGAGGSTGAAGQSGSGGRGQGGAGGTPRCGTPSAIVSCMATAAVSTTTADSCEEAYADSAASLLRVLCSGSERTLMEGAPCPRSAQFAGCCSSTEVANCYYSQADAQAFSASCPQGATWCAP